MKGFTFSQLAVILLVLIALIALAVIGMRLTTDFQDSGSGLLDKAEGVGESFGQCEQIGGKCLIGGCGSKNSLGEELCNQPLGEPPPYHNYCCI